MGQPLWGQTAYKRQDVETVTFRSTLDEAPSDAWDVSEAGDGSVVAWMNGSDLYVAADGKITPNPNASRLFGCFVNLKEIDFGDCFDTTNVTDLYRMFSGCGSLTSLNLSGFDTSKNENTNLEMFDGYTNLTEIKCTDKKILEAYQKR